MKISSRIGHIIFSLLLGVGLMGCKDWGDNKSRVSEGPHSNTKPGRDLANQQEYICDHILYGHTYADRALSTWINDNCDSRVSIAREKHSYLICCLKK